MFAVIIKETLKIWGFNFAAVDETPDYLSIEVPENLDPSCVKAVLIDEVITLVEDPDKVAAKVQAAKDAQIAAAKAAMWADVLTAMETTYGTTDMNSAQALQAMWSELEANPALNISAVFPTVEAIAAYVTPRMILGRQYLAYNLGRRAQFEAEKAAILAAE